MKKLIVSKKGDGQFTSIQDAIDSVRVLSPEPVEILIKPGIYHEIVTVPENKPNIRLVGESQDRVVIVNNRYARLKEEKGREIGTFQTAVMYIYADSITIENVTVQNNAGFGEAVGQAVALYVAGDKGVYKNVTLLGNQDTLYCSKGRQYFLDCYIEGHVDFIFGSATAVFDYCTVHSLRKGYITAASTPKEQKYGFVFRHCKLIGSGDYEVFLGRPWRPHAHTAFLNTYMDKHIHPEGWDNWRDKSNEKTVRYFEYNCFGPGANQSRRVPWANQLSEEEAKKYQLRHIFCREDYWIPIENKSVVEQDG